MADQNKRLRLNLDLDDKSFRDKLRNIVEEVSRSNNQISNEKPAIGNTNMLSAHDRIRYERERAQELNQRFYSQNSSERIEEARRNVSGKGAFGGASVEDQRIVETADQLEKLNQNLSSATGTQRMSEYEQRIRHREYRTLSTKQLEAERDRQRRESRKSEKSGDLDKADEAKQNATVIEGILRDRNPRRQESPELQFMRQTARNLFINDMLGGATSMMGHGTNVIGQSVQGGFQAYSAASSMGMGAGKAGLIGAAIAGVEMLGNMFKGGEQMQLSQFKAGGSLDKSSLVHQQEELNKKFAGIGVGGIQETSQLYEEAAAKARETGYGKNAMERVLEEKYLDKAMGLKDQDLAAFTKFEGEGSMGAAEGSIMFTKMLQKLETGISIGDVSGAGKDLSRLPKYMEKLLQIQEKSLQITGKRDAEETKRNMAMFGSAISMGGIFKNEANAAELMGGIQAGFANPTDELHRFKNLRALRSVKGEISDTDAALQMENMRDPQVVNALIEQYRGDFGENRNTNAGKLRYLQGLQSILGVSSLSKANEFDQRYSATGGLQEQDVSKLMETEKDPMTRLADAAEGLTTDWEKTGATIGEHLTKFAASVTEFSNSIAKFVTKVDAFLGKFDTNLVETGTTLLNPAGGINLVRKGVTNLLK